jgi:hypothetical protein
MPGGRRASRNLIELVLMDDLREIELMGIEMTNSGLEAALVRGGFTPTTMPVPEELGGGTFNAISRVEPME